MDTNVRISALLAKGTARLFLEALESSGMTVLISDVLLIELAEVLHRKLTQTPEQTRDLLSTVRGRAEFISSGVVLNGVCRDPDDDRVLECAINGRADAVVTGDADLLILQAFRGIRIITPRAFLNEISLSLQASSPP